MGDKTVGCAVTASRRIAVLLGGRSAEREVSLVSGRACAEALRVEGFEVVEIDAKDDVARDLAQTAPDAVFNALHGRWGEDGCVQGLLEMLRLPYTHSGVLASALAMHKERAKDVFRAAGLPLAASIVVDRRQASARHAMEPPYVVKPVNEGSSVGVFMVEEFVPGRELTVAVMGEHALGVTEIVPRTAFYDFEAKYAPGGSDHVLPARISEQVAHDAMDIAVRAHKALGCRGVSRADFRFDDAANRHRLILLEVNTQPGMTPTSLVPEQARHVGMDFCGLVRWIVEDASCDR
jgi:D-alanine-D-alanine ligase